MSLGNGEFLRREAAQYARAREIRAKKAAMTPEQREAQRIAGIKMLEAARRKSRLTNLVRSTNHTGPLTAEEEKIRKFVINRDWDGLFNFMPPLWWGKQTGLTHGSPAKYSFWMKPGNIRHYKKFTSDDYLSWTMSKWYTIQPGHECSDEQRRQGVAYYMKGQGKWAAANSYLKPTHVFPFYPGGGARDQSYGCQRDKDSWWVKNRKVVVGAVAVVAAIYLGPAILAKVSGGAASGSGAATGAAATGTGAGSAATTGIVGAGAKAGAVSAVTTKATAVAITTKATTAAAIATKASGAVAAISGVAESGTLFSKVQTATTWINRGRAVDAIIKGELPPPPIGISGNNFTEWAVDLAKKEIVSEVQERTGEYLTKKAREKIERENEARIRAEIQKMQAELAALTKGIPIEPSEDLAQDVRERIIAMQDIEQKRADQNALFLAAGAGALFLMAG
jgi:hypothetical protein